MIQWVFFLASLAPATASPPSSSPPRNSMATGRRPWSWWWLGVWGEAESLVRSALEANGGAADAHLHRALQACLHGRRREGPCPTARRRAPLSHGSVHSSPPSTPAPPWPRQRHGLGLGRRCPSSDDVHCCFQDVNVSFFQCPSLSKLVRYRSAVLLQIAVSWETGNSLISSISTSNLSTFRPVLLLGGTAGSNSLLHQGLNLKTTSIFLISTASIFHLHHIFMSSNCL